VKTQSHDARPSADQTPGGGSALWYAVYTRSRQEKVVHRAIEGAGLGGYLPLRRVLSQWKDRRQWVRKPLFPGYLFVEAAEERLWTVRAVRGVVCVVGDGERPTPVPAAQVESVRRMLEDAVTADPWPYMVAGARVRVVAGPLIGLEGFVVERKNRCHLVVSVDLLGQSVSTEIEASRLEPVR
jgi:transcription antitermination factor NusG